MKVIWQLDLDHHNHGESRDQRAQVGDRFQLLRPARTGRLMWWWFRTDGCGWAESFVRTFRRLHGEHHQSSAECCRCGAAACPPTSGQGRGDAWCHNGITMARRVQAKACRLTSRHLSSHAISMVSIMVFMLYRVHRQLVLYWCSPLDEKGVPPRVACRSAEVHVIQNIGQELLAGSLTHSLVRAHRRSSCCANMGMQERNETGRATQPPLQRLLLAMCF